MFFVIYYCYFGAAFGVCVGEVVLNRRVFGFVVVSVVVQSATLSNKLHSKKTISSSLLMSVFSCVRRWVGG